MYVDAWRSADRAMIGGECVNKMREARTAAALDSSDAGMMALQGGQ